MYLGMGFLGLLILANGIVGYAYHHTNKRLNKVYTSRVQAITIPTDSASIAHGRHLIEGVAQCTSCHGADLGGHLEKEIPLFLTLRGSNITQGLGSVTRDYKNEDWVRTIQHGLRPNGTPVIVMPSDNFANFSATDLGAIIAAIKTYPPVDRKTEPAVLGPIARLVMTFNPSASLIPAESINHETERSVASIKNVNDPGYGRYITEVGGCTHCHRPDFSGGRIAGTPPSIPPASNLTPAGPLAKYSCKQFVNLLQTGKRPDGSELNDIMPWRGTAKMSEEELTSLCNYLKSVPAVH